jgi:F-box-like
MDQEVSEPPPSAHDAPLVRSVALLQSILVASNDTRPPWIVHTREYRAFVLALEQLESVHRNISTSWNESADVSRSSPGPSLSFLQYVATDDILLRIFRYVDCGSVVNAGRTCTRFRDLANAHAVEMSRPMAARRQLASPMALWKAYEQVVMGGYAVSRHAPIPARVVPIPTLLLSKCVRVRACGDAEYNGIYHCTGCNGNGYVFTKPRYPIQHRPVVDHTDPSVEDTAECHGAEHGQPLRCILAKRFSEEVRMQSQCQ